MTDDNVCSSLKAARARGRRRHRHAPVGLARVPHQHHQGADRPARPHVRVRRRPHPGQRHSLGVLGLDPARPERPALRHRQPRQLLLRPELEPRDDGGRGGRGHLRPARDWSSSGCIPTSSPTGRSRTCSIRPPTASTSWSASGRPARSADPAGGAMCQGAAGAAPISWARPSAGRGVGVATGHGGRVTPGLPDAPGAAGRARRIRRRGVSDAPGEPDAAGMHTGEGIGNSDALATAPRLSIARTRPRSVLPCPVRGRQRRLHRSGSLPASWPRRPTSAAPGSPCHRR